MVQKILLLGLDGAGKTTIIRHILEGKEFDELSLSPTEGVKTDEYRYRRLVEIAVFDCGGQSQFLEGYFTETLERTIFSNVRVFFWVLDVSDRARIEKSRFWFIKAYESLKKYSPNAKIYVLAHKSDLKNKLSKEELKKLFIEAAALPGVKYFTSSVKNKTARHIICKLLDELIEKTETERTKSLQGLLDRLNKRFNAKMIMLINKDDGLEIASSINAELSSKVATKESIEFLQYLSIKTLIYPLNMAQHLVDEFRDHHFLESKVLHTSIFKFDAEYLILKDIHPLVSIFIITPISEVAIDKYEQEIDKITPQLREILKV